VRIETSRDRQIPGGMRHAGGDIRFYGRRRWVRLAVYWGVPPGSHIGLWRTDTGTVHGWNLRIGWRHRSTIEGFCHTRKARASDAPRSHLG
jgi:hypothetical protein